MEINYSPEEQQKNSLLEIFPKEKSLSPNGYSDYNNISHENGDLYSSCKNLETSFSSNQKPITLAIDVMGGDHAPESVMDGVFLFHQDYPQVSFQFFGHEEKINYFLRKYPSLTYVSQVFPTTEVIEGHTKITQALRHLPQSSMRLALQAVAKGEAHGAISAGNTGVYLALAKMILKTMDSIDRPAIISEIPTKKGSCVMLDLGGMLEASSRNLFEYALMGSIFSQALLKIPSPKIGLLNVGSEETKGNDCLQQAFYLLKESSLNFYGFIEGHDINKGLVDVVVVNGFAGNIALKTAEGVTHFMMESLKDILQRNFWTRCGAFLLKSHLKSLKNTFDPRLYNGAFWLGLNGIAVKSHGGADSLGFYNALKKTYFLIENNIVHHIQQGAKEARL